MYSKSTSDKFGELNIPGNYSGNAFRLQNTANTASTPSSPPLPGFYRQVQRKGVNSNSGEYGNRYATNSHTSFSARDTELAPRIITPDEDTKEEGKFSIEPIEESPPEFSDFNTTRSSEQSTDTNRKSIDFAKIINHLPESDDLLLLGLLILLMQSKGNEDLMMIIAMLLMT